MKVFWALLAVLMAGAVVLVMRRQESGTVGIPAPVIGPRVERPAPGAVRTAVPPDDPNGSPAAQARPPEGGTDRGVPDDDQDDAGPDDDEDSGLATAGDRPAREGGSQAAKIEKREDGSVLVDGRFLLRGEGTAESPYQVTWDQLLSAQDDYIPKEGRKKIPERIAMLDGKVVELTGHIAFPVMSETEDECLSMMNQWDGCCIGIPPTPYDAVEVRLRDAVDSKERLTTYGSVKGTLKVEPHLVGGWLVGLYVMDDAELSPTSFGGFAP
ncbi:MAG: hypothetical protein WD749_02005 [Phycisphaerales bacterium]